MLPVFGFVFGFNSRKQTIVSYKPVVPIVGGIDRSRFNQTRNRGGATIKGGTACHALSDSVRTNAIIAKIRIDRKFTIIVFLNCSCRAVRQTIFTSDTLVGNGISHGFNSCLVAIWANEAREATAIGSKVRLTRRNIVIVRTISTEAVSGRKITLLGFCDCLVIFKPIAIAYFVILSSVKSHRPTPIIFVV